MQISDNSLILTIKPHTETSMIVKCLTNNHGIFSGVVKVSKNNNISAANLFEMEWKARLEEHLGYMKLELLKSYSSRIMFDKKKIFATKSLVSIITSIFQERQHIEGLFELMINYLELLSYENFSIKDYIKQEIELLKISGYALDLTKCCLTGDKNNLSYLSPKTGRAVSKSAGLNYHDKLLSLPQFIYDDQAKIEKIDIINALKLTEYFFNRYLYKDSGKKFPEIRALL